MSKKILIVDDEPNNLYVLKGILEKDYVLFFSNSGKEALSSIAKHSPDLILLDVMMPEMDGYEVCRIIKANPAISKIPVIFITTMGRVEEESKGFDIGAVDYITKPVNPPIVLRRVATHPDHVRVEELEKMTRSAIYMLGEIGHYNDDDTGVHIWRMAAYSTALATAAGWSSEQISMLELASPMHDTGKIGIPDAILKAPRKLMKDEWEVMKTHSWIGYNILNKSDAPLFQMAKEIAYSHHEKWDGSGYPQGIVGEAIPDSARIVAIADVFDALTMKRPYKDAWSVDDAYEEIKRSAGTHLDPSWVDCFFSIDKQIRQIKVDWDSRE